MLSRRERVLLAALFWTASGVAAAIALYIAGQGGATVRERVRLAEREVARLAAAPVASAPTGDLEALVVEARAKLYAPGEMDPYRFGIIVRDLLREQGLTIARYQTVEKGPSTLLEFSVEGSARALASFLERVSVSPRFWSVSYLSIRGGERGGSVQAVLRIGYEQASGTGG